MSKAFSTIIFLLSVAAAVSCRQKPKAASTADEPVYYPINNYLQRQIKTMDTSVSTFYRSRSITTRADSTTQSIMRKDSAVISRAAFDSAVRVFLQPALEEASLKKQFAEAIFADESTGSFTFTYTPKAKDNPLQSATVLVDTASQLVKWIFINKLENAGDSTTIVKLGWHGNENCFINRAVTGANGRERMEQVNFSWRFLNH